jgi:hypothetical protein
MLDPNAVMPGGHGAQVFVGEVCMKKFMHGLAIDELDRRVGSYETVILV